MADVTRRAGMATVAVAAGLVGASAVLGAAACSDPTNTTSSGVTYFKDAKPILDAKCSQCHYEGGIAPFSLKTYADASKHASAIKGAVNARTMPPWLADDDCNSYEADRSLTEEQIATLTKWVDGDAAEGDPADEPAPLATYKGLSRVDRTLGMAASYTPTKEPDDYRCFVIDWPETSVKYLTGFRAKPGEARVVHHVIAFLASGDDAKTATDKDAAEPGAGYTCYGGPGFNSAGWLGSWAPGGAGSDYPAGTGVRIEPGSKVVLQVHYNTLTAGPLPDLTSVEMKLDDAVEKEAHIQPWANPKWLTQGGMPIPPATEGVHFEWAFDPTAPFAQGKPITIYSVGLHMHQLGHTATLGVAKKSGGDQCLLDIPEWNFHWQGSYQLTQPFVLEPGDKLALSCDFDNPTMGMVDWGEGTEDEMCLGVFYYTVN
ncbi:MAG: monooxygenase [Polyangiaceae bacterium]